MKEIFLLKKKNKMKKKIKKNYVHIEIFQENKRERNLKVTYY